MNSGQPGQSAKNRNKCIVHEIIKGIGKEFVTLEYIREPGDENFDDLPSEQLQPGDIVYPKWNKAKPEGEEFNS